MELKAGEIGTAPPSPDVKATSVGPVIGMPVWLWVDNPDEHTVGPNTKTASAGAVSVTATATLDKIIYTMGDGGQRVCEGDGAPGTKWNINLGTGQSPTCGYTYTKTSKNQPGGRYTITATSYWTVDWSGGGQNGEIPLEFERTITIPVVQIQSIITG
jgi:hypothetical protein